MRIKKGFTLAEILIVLMVIGVIATMTIPSLMRGVTEQQWKTAFNKTYNAVANIATMERVSGLLPAVRENAEGRVYDSLVTNLSVREYATPVASGQIASNTDYTTAATYKNGSGNDVTIGTVTDGSPAQASQNLYPWIITEDNLAYTVLQTLPGDGQYNGEERCATKNEILTAKTFNEAAQISCSVVYVDVNGLSAGPNITETQIINNDFEENGNMNPLTGDRYYIFIGMDGATTGSKVYSVMGRISAGIK